MSEDGDNYTKQTDEIEALTSIYGDTLTVRLNSGQRACEISLEDVTLTVTMPITYPSDSPPSYEISAPFLSGSDKQNLSRKLENIYAEGFIGEPGVIYAWAECVREHVDGWRENKKFLFSDEALSDEEEKNPEPRQAAEKSNVKCPEILTGECLEDRKSIFQPHFAKVTSLEEVQAVVNKLYENRKIANATHNMYAYRIKQESKGLLQDCEDDGETHAGSRMLHLLDILNVENVLVVVSRWYGGIQLGADRFKHINNATRSVLELAGVVQSSKSATKNKSSKKGKK